MEMNCYPMDFAVYTKINVLFMYCGMLFDATKFLHRIIFHKTGLIANCGLFIVAYTCMHGPCK